MQDKYNHLEVERAAQAHWTSRDAYRVVEDARKKKFYACSMLPYPSGKLHVAHVQLAAGVRQDRAGVELLLAGVLDHPVGIARRPVRLGGALDLEVVVLVLHGGILEARCQMTPRHALDDQ